MRTAFAVLLLGIAAGSVGVSWFLGTERSGYTRVTDDAQSVERSSSAARAGEPAAGGDVGSPGSDFLAAANDDPQAAFDALLAMPDARARARAAARVATAWGRVDPERAMTSAELLPGDEAVAFRSAVSAEWARRDPEGFVDFLARGASTEETSGGVQWLLASDPEALLRAADLRPDGASLRMVVFSSLAESDPAAAARHVEALPPGRDREAMIAMVAMPYAMRDPDAALAWLDGFELTNPNVRMVVAAAVARSDINRGLDMFGPAGGQAAQMMLGMVFTEAAQDPEQARKMATQLLGRRDQIGTTALASLVTNWMQSEPESALRWIEAEGERVDSVVVGTAANALAGRDPALAASYTQRVPERLRSAWITPVAGAYARQDVDAALQWVAQFEREPGYADAYARVATQLAQTDPAAAARLLSAVPDAEARAAGSVAAAWARRDAAAAMQWALGLPSGATRDNALASMLSASAAARDSAAVLAAFSSDAARQSAFARAIPTIAREDREAAQRLLETHVTDPALRRQLDEQLRALGGR